MASRTLPQVPHDEALGRSVLNHTQKSVLLYGLGVVGKRTFFDLQSLGITIEAILDGDTRLRGQSFEGVPIYAPEEFRGTSKPVIIASYVYYREICSQLNGLRYEKLLPYFFYLSGSETDTCNYSTLMLEYARLKHQIEVPDRGCLELKSVDLTITEKCSLKCKDCANLMQYFKQPSNEDFDICIKAIDRLLQTVDRIYEVRILGGEPLMNPDLAEYISAIKAFDSFDYIVIFTNATILPSEKLLECMSDPRVLVRISDYGLENQRCAEWASVMEQRDILYIVDRITQWFEWGKIGHNRRTIEENREVLRQCVGKKCPSVKNGKFFPCPFAGSAAALSACPTDAIQFVDLVYAAKTRDELREDVRALMELKHLHICDYCTGRSRKEECVPPARQISETVSYRSY